MHVSKLRVFVCLSSLMQRRYSEPNTYIDTLPSISHNSDELYDDVASIADPEVCSGLKCTIKQINGNKNDYFWYLTWINVVYFTNFLCNDNLEKHLELLELSTS